MPSKPVIQPIVSGMSTSTKQPSLKKARKSRVKTDVVYSQPANTGPGQNIMTQLVAAVEYLKNSKRSMCLKELAIYSDTALISDPILLEKFKAHDRVVHHAESDSYSYRHDVCFESKQELLSEIKRCTNTLETGGISMQSLQAVSKDAPKLVEELEKDGEVLVTRTGKSNRARNVFWNEIKPNEESGGIPVEQEFRDLWRSLVVPDDTDLLKALKSEGIEPTVAEKKITTLKRPGIAKKNAKKRGHARIANVHLKDEIDLTKDYVPARGTQSTSK